jgi:hypothetical protein
MRTVMLEIRVVALAAAAGLLAAMAAGTASADASPVSQASQASQASQVQSAAASSPHWSRVTPNGTLNIADVGLAMTGQGVLNVLWADGVGSAGHAAIKDTAISASGAVGRTATVVGGQLLVSYPDATVVGSRIDAVWNAIESNTGPEGSFIATRALAGGAWSAPTDIAQGSDFPFANSSVATTTGADSQPWVAYYGTGSLLVDHVGQASAHQDAPSDCCYNQAGLAVDGHSGQTWLGYASLVLHHEGIYVQRLATSGAAAGARQLLPGSVTKGSMLVLNQRIGITGRGHGRSGVYVAYVTGFPIGLHVELLKLGTPKPLTLASTGIGAGFADATVTADPAGGLWTAWYQGDGSPAALFVRQSNNAVTKWSKAVRVALPAGTTTIFKVYISAQRSRLDVLALLTTRGKTAYWATQVR